MAKRLFIAFILIGAVARLHAEGLCSLMVRVFDAEDQPLATATVTIHRADGFTSSLQATDGVASFSVPPGEYTVEVEHDGIQAPVKRVSVGPMMWDPIDIRFEARPVQPPPLSPMPSVQPSVQPDIVVEERVEIARVTVPLRRASHATVRVHYATDRAYSGETAPTKLFGHARGQLHYGEAEVSIPREHRMGALEEPSILRFEYNENPEKHVVLLRVSPQRDADFFARLRASVGRSARHEAMLFIHGYNTTFADAVRRTAQLKYDLAFDGPAVVYSWPSFGSVSRYPADETNADWASANLREVLERLRRETGATSIDVIAHSMGNRVLLRAMETMTPQPGVASFQHVVLTAPDDDADVFRRLALSVRSLCGHVTLYASSSDRALAMSKRFHAGDRAGEAGPHILVIDGVETIDVTDIDCSFLGHSYVSDNRTVLSDLYCLLRGGDAGRRCGLIAKMAAGRYWAFARTLSQTVADLAHYRCAAPACQ
ncbi:MAG TPA: alpha/beta hydrolase, partial [Thermoanaerobaculia bacterium]|nr:alpha/beta hydrolase [Thermoanaerobaculia bacterium]